MAEDSQSKPKQFFPNFLLAGTIGAFSKTLLAPLETHTTYYPYINLDGTRYLKQMLKEQGPSAFWKNNGLKIKNYFLAQGFNFAFFDLFRSTFCSSLDQKTEFWRFLLSHMAAGAAAGGLTNLILYPLQLWKLSIKSLSGAWEKAIFSKEEILGRFKGFGGSVISPMVYRSLYFGGYETAKKEIITEGNLVIKYFTALCVAIIAGLLNHPVDVVRRKIGMRFVRSEGEVVHYKGALDCAKKIYNEAGWKVFVGISGLNLVYAVVAALNLVLYDELQSYLLFQEKVVVI